MVATRIETSGNALFGHRNYVLSAALSASSAISALGVGNLQNDHGSVASAWQTAMGVMAASLLIDVGGLAPWRMFGLFRTNLTSGARVRWRLSNSADMSNPVYDSGWLDAGVRPEYLQHVHCPPVAPAFVPEPAPVLETEDEVVMVTEDGDSIEVGPGPSDILSVDALDDFVIDEFLGAEDGGQIIGEGTGIPSGGPLLARYCRLDIEDLSNPDLFLSIPFVYAGDAWEPSRQISSGSSWGMDSRVDEVVMKGGQEYPDFQFMRRRWDIAVDSLPDADVFTGLAEVMRYALRGRNLLFVPFPQGERRNFEAVFGRFVVKSDISFVDKSGQHRAFRATVTERL